ncbi:unnamed protein product [Musa acuminata subsp. burmannicoides]
MGETSHPSRCEEEEDSNSGSNHCANRADGSVTADGGVKSSSDLAVYEQLGATVWSRRFSHGQELFQRGFKKHGISSGNLPRKGRCACMGNGGAVAFGVGRAGARVDAKSTRTIAPSSRS